MGEPITVDIPHKLGRAEAHAGTLFAIRHHFDLGVLRPAEAFTNGIAAEKFGSSMGTLSGLETRSS